MAHNLEQSENLILLVGTNPLPNYVAAKLLLKEGGQLYLLHSADTRPIKERLEVALSTKAIPAEVNESDAADIAAKMTGLVESINGGSIGLHYTGGTKVMAVHAHKAFLEAMRRYHPGQKPVCSYLDARSYEMKFDPQPGQSGFGEKVLQAEKVDLKTVLSLHDIKLTGGALETGVRLPKSARVLAKLHTNKEAAKEWRSWCEKELKPKTWHLIGSKKRYERELAQITLTLPANDDLRIAIDSILTELGLPLGKTTIALSAPQISQAFGKPRRFCRWLDGIWLENYVFNEISAIAEEAGLNDMAMSLDTLQIPGKPNFEFDVGVMKGYQLFGLSCSTTQNKGLAKSKLFEAYIRAGQLGGDEARVGLVCPQPGLKKLEKELPKSVQGKVRIFDSSHIENLRAKLQNWFENAK